MTSRLKIINTQDEEGNDIMRIVIYGVHNIERKNDRVKPKVTFDGGVISLEFPHDAPGRSIDDIAMIRANRIHVLEREYLDEEGRTHRKDGPALYKKGNHDSSNFFYTHGVFEAEIGVNDYYGEYTVNSAGVFVKCDRDEYMGRVKREVDKYLEEKMD